MCTCDHTDRGIVRLTLGEYEGEGTSHLHAALKNGSVPLDAGVHLYDAGVYERVQTIVTTALGRGYTLPNIDAARAGVPEQVKVSITQRSGEMVVNFLTFAPPHSASAPSSAVQYGLASGAYTQTTLGRCAPFIDPNPMHILRYIHDVVLSGLEDGTRYYYRVGDAQKGVWSGELTFTTLTSGRERLTVALYGDLGIVNSNSVQLLSQYIAADAAHLVVSTPV
jgi:hypothetical protein